jgi:AcrR family transcriptional regulator
MARRQLNLQRADKDTRRQLLEAAGQVFGEKGFDRATGKEITEQAGTNTASVNYYFGGLEGLYQAVLKEAHGRLFTFETLATAIAAETSPAAKLHAITATVVRAATGPLSGSWVLRVLGREMVAPSLSREPLRDKTEVFSKMLLIRGVIGEFMGLPEDHPAVARACISFVSPFLVLLIVDRPTLGRTFAGADLAPTGADALIEEMYGYALAGLSAIASEARKSGAGRASLDRSGAAGSHPGAPKGRPAAEPPTKRPASRRNVTRHP